MLLRKAYSSALILFLAIPLAFTALCLGGQKKTPPSRKPSLEQSLRSPKPADRFNAVSEMRKNRGKVPVETIKAAARSEKDPLVRRHLQEELAVSGQGGVEADLVQSLKTDPSPMVRQGAAQSLGNYIQTPGVLEALAEALEKETDDSVRYSCALSLALSDTPASDRALEKAAMSPDPNLRRQTAYSLTRHTSRQARRIIKKLLRDEDPGVRRAAGAKK